MIRNMEIDASIDESILGVHFFNSFSHLEGMFCSQEFLFQLYFFFLPKRDNYQQYALINNQNIVTCSLFLKQTHFDPNEIHARIKKEIWNKHKWMSDFSKK